MRKGILLAVVILLSAAGLTQAQDELKCTLDVTYMSSYIWRGFDYYADDHGAIQASIDIDLYNTGFGLQVLNRRALSGAFVNSEGLDVTLYYNNKIFESEAYSTNYSLGWVYYGFPDESRSGSTNADAQAAHMQEFFAAFSWPSICPFGVVPSYTILTMWPSEGDSVAHNNAGRAHIFGLGYDLTVPGFMPETAEQTLHLSASAVYNDGVAPGVVIGAASGTIDHEWSHAVLGVSTNLDMGNNVIIVPGVYHQLSMEDTVNTEDETWVTVSMKYAF